MELLFKLWREIEKLSDNDGHNFLVLRNISEMFRFTTSKMVVDI